MKKINYSDFLLPIIIGIFLFALIFSFRNIITWFIERHNILKQLDEINNIVEIIETGNTSDTIFIKPEEEIDSNEEENISEESKTPTEKPDLNQTNNYWEYINMNLIDVNFQELKKKNNQTVGWLQVNGTNVNYPFVQTTNNQYYLNHSFDKSYNTGGWVFLDYRNNIKELDKNTIIYAHGRNDKTMFGSLKDILSNGWLNNPDNFVIKMSTINENTLWQIFSIYVIPTTNDYIRINFLHNNDFYDFTNTLLERSSFNFNTTINKNDNILTLSTCFNKQEKLVIHAKLIKKELK